MGARLSDEQIYDLVHRMLLLVRGKRGQTELGDGAIDAMTTFMDAIQQSLIVNMDGLGDKMPTPEMIEIKLRLPREAHDGLQRYIKDQQPRPSLQGAIAYAIGGLLARTGHFRETIDGPGEIHPLEITLHLQRDLIAAVDDFRRKQPDRPNRPEAIRRLVIDRLDDERTWN